MVSARKGSGRHQIQKPSPAKVGTTIPVFLEQTITDRGHDTAGPHRTGKARVLPDGRLEISITDTNAGRHASGMLADDLLDAVHWQGTVRLRVPSEAKGVAKLWKGLANSY